MSQTGTGMPNVDRLRAPETEYRTRKYWGWLENITPEETVAYFEPLVALVHGYASLIANNAMIYDPEAIRQALVTVAVGLERK